MSEISRQMSKMSEMLELLDVTWLWLDFVLKVTVLTVFGVSFAEFLDNLLNFCWISWCFAEFDVWCLYRQWCQDMCCTGSVVRICAVPAVVSAVVQCGGTGCAAVWCTGSVTRRWSRCFCSTTTYHYPLPGYPPPLPSTSSWVHPAVTQQWPVHQASFGNKETSRK